MSRGWDDNCDEGLPLDMWVQSLENAMNGKRGQKFLRELETEMLAMQARGEGRLLAGYLMADGRPMASSVFQDGEFREVLVPTPVGCCTLGVLCRKKDIATDFVNRELEGAYGYPSELPERLDIAQCLVTEIGVENDCAGGDTQKNETDEQRFERMLRWVQAHISRNGEKVCR